MNQKGKRSRNYRDEAAGSNVLFTLGLVSVVALLIVGWVMTKGGVDNVLNGNGGDMPGISLVSTPTPQPQPTPSGNTLNTTMDPNTSANQGNVNVEQIRQQLRQQLEDEYQQKLLEAQMEYENDLEDMRMKFQSEIDDLKIQIQMLEIDNQTLRQEVQDEESNGG